jgi:hypothetical protein
MTQRHVRRWIAADEKEGAANPGTGGCDMTQRHVQRRSANVIRESERRSANGVRESERRSANRVRESERRSAHRIRESATRGSFRCVFPDQGHSAANLTRENSWIRGLAASCGERGNGRAGFAV